MKLSVSNIAWGSDDDDLMYRRLAEMGFSGLEIAPTRIFPDKPYSCVNQARQWSEQLLSDYGLTVPSMQSIWYGRSENIFVDALQRQLLIEYTMRAIDFAEAIGCHNLVFGCPRNRDTANADIDMPVAIEFFRTVGEYAHQHNTVIAIEANPVIYNTRFINTTAQAISLCNELGSPGIRINLDLGTMIYNNEDLSVIADHTNLISHVHISEPYLRPIMPRRIHYELLSLLKDKGYKNYVSIEMGNTGCTDDVINAMKYIKELI